MSYPFLGWKNHSPNSKIYIDHLMIQPTYNCALNCNKCYVKEHEIANSRVLLGSDIWSNLFISLSLAEKVQPKQITIALDDLPITPDKMTIRAEMLNIIRNFISIFKDRNKETVVAATSNSWKTFSEYDLTQRPLSYDPSFDLVTLSYPPRPHLMNGLEKLRQNGVVFNQNITIDTITPLSLEEHLRNTLIINSQYFDSFYLLLLKDYSSNRPNNQNIQDVIELIYRLKDNLPYEVSEKIVIDDCLTDSLNYLEKGHTCSAGISKIHVWPDGRVSGCPYMTAARGKVAETAQDIIDNIRAEVGSNKDFNSCYIPDELKNNPLFVVTA